MKRFIVLLLSLLSISLFISCGKSGIYEESFKMEEIIGTVITVEAYGISSNKAVEKAFDRAKELEEILSVEIESSEISKVNSTAYKEEVHLSDELFYVLKKSLYYAELTEGAFDPTIGILIDLWSIGTEKAKIPDNNDIDSYKNNKGYKKVILNEKNKTVKFEDKDIQLNFGAIAKGYIADEMKKVLIDEFNIKSAILNLGGNVVTIGNKESGEPWKIGICNPINTYEISGSVEVEGKTIVTSGNYEKYFEEDGVRYHHILDPSTGYPSKNGCISSTIITENSIDADALSTAVYVLGTEDGKRLIESIDGVEAIFINEDMSIEKTSGCNSSEINFKALGE